MDVNTLFAASSIGRQDDIDSKIVKQVWGESHSNMTAVEVSDTCEHLEEDFTAIKKCTKAAMSCVRDSDCDEMAKRYAKALGKGYSKDFEDFKRRSASLAQAGDLGKEILSWFAKGNYRKGDNQNYDVYPQNAKKSNTGLYIGLGVVAVAAIGVTIYFATRKK